VVAVHLTRSLSRSRVDHFPPSIPQEYFNGITSLIWRMTWAKHTGGRWITRNGPYSPRAAKNRHCTQEQAMQDHARQHRIPNSRPRLRSQLSRSGRLPSRRQASRGKCRPSENQPTTVQHIWTASDQTIARGRHRVAESTHATGATIVQNRPSASNQTMGNLDAVAPKAAAAIGKPTTVARKSSIHRRSLSFVRPWLATCFNSKIDD
jgi:hypothetical protein